MSIRTDEEMKGMARISEVVGITLKAMREYARPGMSTKELDDYGYGLLRSYGARPAPLLTYNFPGCTCISVNQAAAHGIPSSQVILQEGDLVNIDVSAELDGYWSDNGGSFVLGEDIRQLNPLVNASREILRKAIYQIRDGVKIAEVGGLIEKEARKAGFRVIKNLFGHGIGRSLHEEPHTIACYYDRFNRQRFKKNSVVAVETFISTRASRVYTAQDGWTLGAKDGSYVAQHEHTIVVTDGEPVILTASNGIWADGGNF